MTDDSKRLILKYSPPPPKRKIAIQGGNGRVGSAIASILAPHYEVTAADTVVPGPEHFAVINAAPYHTSVPLARAAIEVGAHYLDLTEDVGTARELKLIAASAATMVAPQCGLAPGLVSIIAGSMARKYDRLHTMKLRVGGLPRHPTNALGYALTWNVEGLINQYRNPATAIRNGERVTVTALDDVEELRYESGLYEAFNTSGGIGTLCDSYPNAVNIDYKTIRYPGHAKLMQFLLHDLGLSPVELKEIFERAIPHTDQDVVLIGVTTTGFKDGVLSQATYSKQITGRPGMSALRFTTAASVCAMLDMMAAGSLNWTGFVKQEDIPIEKFISNRFGKVFA